MCVCVVLATLESDKHSKHGIRVSYISSDGSRVKKYAVCLLVDLLSFKLMYIGIIFPGICVIGISSVFFSS